MLTAILTSASVGQKLRIFVGSKISETKWQKLNKTAAGSVSTRSASASVSASAVEGLPRCSETCAEKVLQNVTYHNNCHEKIRSFIRFCGKGKFCFGHQKFGTPTSFIRKKSWNHSELGPRSLRKGRRKGRTALAGASQVTLTLVRRQLLIRITLASLPHNHEQ